MKNLSLLATIGLGVLLVIVLAPLSQFLTVMTVNADIETMTPVGYAVGIIFALALVTGVVRWIARRRSVSKVNLVVLYAMLTVAVPAMNLGLVRPAYMSMRSVINEYFWQGNSTYKTAYNQLKPEWFPIVPTRDGMAYNKVARLLRLLERSSDVSASQKAAQKLKRALVIEAQLRQTDPNHQAPQQIDPNHIKAVDRLLIDPAGEILKGGKGKWSDSELKALGIEDKLQQRHEQLKEASAEARKELPGLLEGVTEFHASLLPSVWGKLDENSKARIIDAYPESETPQGRAEKLGDVLQKGPQLRDMVTALSREAYSELRSELVKEYRQRYRQMPDDELAALRHDFVFRLTWAERKDIASQDGEGGTPNQDFMGFEKTVWANLKDQSGQEEVPHEKLDEAVEQMPWHLYAKPILMWTLLFALIFMLIMCIAEWFRRKWIDRENLAFPLVEVADMVIRQGSDLEMASNLQDPPKRKLPFSPVFAMGFVVSFFLLTLSALDHYGFTAVTKSEIYFDVSKELFTSGALKEMSKVFLVLSPIILGLAFLVSLEISFSVWVLFFLWSFAMLIGKLSYPDVKDSLFTGWAGGRQYPFPMEQMLGAALCFTAIILFKSLRGSRAHRHAAHGDYFIPPRLNFVGLVVLPLAIFALLWHLGPARGLNGILFMILMAALAMSQMIAAARARAETGLPTHHVSYEFTKAPIVFGMTGWTGASVYASFVTIAFLPLTLLFRSLPQHLENMELARRNGLKLRTIAVASLLAFVVAVLVGMICLPAFSYYLGGKVWGESSQAQTGQSNFAIARYSLWVSHYLGEEGLDQWTQVHWIRVWFVLAGAATFGLLSFLRGRFLRFPLHPIGYLLILLAIYYQWVSPYFKGDSSVATANESSWLWASVFLAWLLKKLIIKYGGMNSYKRAKPFFIGLVVGSVVCLFFWNILDMGCSIVGAYQQKPGEFVKRFMEIHPFSPKFY